MSTLTRNIKIGIYPPHFSPAPKIQQLQHIVNITPAVLNFTTVQCVMISIFQETAAALTGVTGAHSSFPTSLLPSDVSSGQGRRQRPLPAHLASTAWGQGSPFNRRTHKCDYPDCDKVTYFFQKQSKINDFGLLRIFGPMCNVTFFIGQGFKRFNYTRYKSRYGHKQIILLCSFPFSIWFLSALANSV